MKEMEDTEVGTFFEIGPKAETVLFNFPENGPSDFSAGPCAQNSTVFYFTIRAHVIYDL